MKRLSTILLLLLSFKLFAQTSCTGFTRATGAVIGNQVVTLMPINPAGFCYIQGLVYYPDDYNLPANASKRYPLLVTLNGAGEGQSQDIAELCSNFIPQYISNGLKPYAIDQVTGDTIKFIVVSPHAASTGSSYFYPQLKYTIPWMLSNLRVDTNCVWVTGLSMGCRGTVSLVMGDALGDTVLGKLLTGIIPLSGAGYDDRLVNGSGANRNLDSLLKRGLRVKYGIGNQDPSYNTLGFFAYDSVYRRFAKPGYYVDSVFPNIAHTGTVWNAPWPIPGTTANRIFDPKTQTIWTQMWNERRNSPPTQLTVYAGADQTITLPTSSALLAGTATPAPGTGVASYLWSQVSGPNTATLATPATSQTNATGLIQGTYLFRLQATSTASTTAADTVQVLVQAAVLVPPTVNLPSSQTIFQPASSASLTASVNQGTGAITSRAWTFISGPVTPTIATPTQNTTNITGMSATGTYVFKFTATDANGLSDNGNVQITVTTAPASAIHIVKPALSEYLCAHLYSDGVARTYIFNNVTGKVEFTSYIIGGLQCIDIAPLFNRMSLLDVNNYSWVSNSGTPTCTRIDSTNDGRAMNFCDRIYGYFYGLFQIKTDSTEIWYGGTGVNGDTYNFYGFTNNDIGTKPRKFNAPAGKKWVKLALGKNVLGLASDGTVWMWRGGTGSGSTGKGDTNYVQITGYTGKAIDVAASQMDFYGILAHDYANGDPTMGNPYVFGSQPSYWGGTNSSTTAVSVRSLWGLTQSCREMFMNNNTIHVIDSSRHMWGIGDNPQGEVGIGTEIVNRRSYGTPYSWSWIKDEAQTGAPMRAVAPTVLFKHGFSGNAFAFYLWALDMNDSSYNWGRDKSFIGGKGRVNSNEVATPNSLDILAPRMITPIANTPATGFNFIMPTVNAGVDQNINTSTANLSGTGTPASAGSWGYSVSSMTWAKISGPTCTITTPVSSTSPANTTVTGMTAGIYQFTLTMVDNNSGIWYDTVQIIVSGTVFTPPTVIVSSNQNLILPTNSATISAVVTPHGATLVSTVWSKQSGPAAGSISTPNTLSTTVTELVAGTYVFRMTATDSNGQTTTGDVTIVVQTLSNNCNCLTSPVPVAYPNNY